MLAAGCVEQQARSLLVLLQLELAVHLPGLHKPNIPFPRCTACHGHMPVLLQAHTHSSLQMSHSLQASSAANLPQPHRILEQPLLSPSLATLQQRPMAATKLNILRAWPL